MTAHTATKRPAPPAKRNVGHNGGRHPAGPRINKRHQLTVGVRLWTDAEIEAALRYLWEVAERHTKVL